MVTTHGEIDAHRPWIRDIRDDPGAMDWVQTLFNPFGETSKLHFTRAWTLMFMGRLLLYVVPSFGAFIIGIAGVKTEAFNTPVDLAILTVPALLVPFVIYTFATEFTSIVAHARRLGDARRPTWLAVIVLVPMILGLAAYYAGTVAGSAQYAELTKPAAERVEGKAKDGAAAAKKQPERRGPPKKGPPPSERQMAVSTGMSMGLPVWALGSLGVMIWTLTYVGRLPNGGAGRIRTGSDLSEAEIAAEI